MLLDKSRIFFSIKFSHCDFLFLNTFPQVTKFILILTITHKAILLAFTYLERCNIHAKEEDRDAFQPICTKAALRFIFCRGYYWALSTFGIWEPGRPEPTIPVQLRTFFTIAKIFEMTFEPASKFYRYLQYMSTRGN